MPGSAPPSEGTTTPEYQNSREWTPCTFSVMPLSDSNSAFAAVVLVLNSADIFWEMVWRGFKPRFMYSPDPSIEDRLCCDRRLLIEGMADPFHLGIAFLGELVVAAVRPEGPADQGRVSL